MVLQSLSLGCPFSASWAASPSLSKPAATVTQSGHQFRPSRVVDHGCRYRACPPPHKVPSLALTRPSVQLDSPQLPRPSKSTVRSCTMALSASRFADSLGSSWLGPALCREVAECLPCVSPEHRQLGSHLHNESRGPDPNLSLE